MEVKEVRPARVVSYERRFHQAGVRRFMLPLRGGGDLSRRLEDERLEWAIGVVYRPETELQSHYFYALLARQFDEYIWFDKSEAVEPLVKRPDDVPADTFPFGV
jgi:protein-L-isoaspartate(D-aspartate) O-methyltransferase